MVQSMRETLSTMSKTVNVLFNTSMLISMRGGYAVDCFRAAANIYIRTPSSFMREIGVKGLRMVQGSIITAKKSN